MVCRAVSCLMPKRFRMSGLSEKGVTSPPVSAPTGSPASLMALAGDRAAPWPLRPKESGSSAPEEVGFAVDSLLEGDGFELLVPRHESPRFPKHPGTIAAPTVRTSATVRISASRPRAVAIRGAGSRDRAITTRQLQATDAGCFAERCD